MTTAHIRRAGWLTTAVAGAVAALLALGLATAPTASAAPRVTVSSSLGAGRVSLDGSTSITVSGSGFQSIQGGFGGIYVFFGTVRDASGGGWAPSAGGSTGVDYLYVPDTEAKDNQGFQRFVTFPGSGTASAANGGELAADGTWSLTMNVPGPVFDTRDREGVVQTIDCREVTCGIITIGAHGVVNANNETFTPVTFVSSSGQATSEGEGQATDDAGAVAGTTDEDGSTGDDGDEDDAAAPGAVTDGPATVGLEQGTIIAGRVLGFTGRGFAPGEQVVAVLTAGLAGAGPITAGQFGEVAGAITLPADIRPGTHTLTLTGAGSEQTAEATLTVMADPASMAAQTPAETGGWNWAFIALVAAAGVLLILVVSSAVTAVLRRRRDRARTRGKRAEADSEGATEPDGPGPGSPAPAPSGAAHSDPIDDTQVIPPVRRSTRMAGTR